MIKGQLFVKVLAKWGAIFIGFLLVLGVAGLLVISFSPSTGAYAADALRKIVGNEAVAALETVVFKVQDLLKNTEYKTGVYHPEGPWSQTDDQTAVNSNGTVAPRINDTVIPFPTLNPGMIQSTKISAQQENVPLAQGEKPGIVSTPDAVWNPPTPDVLGSMRDAGKWQSYITDTNGKVVAYRTFFQPDPSRPYAIMGVVAFDVEHTRLNFVVGQSDPYAPGVSKHLSGTIPDSVKVPGKLLAAFNGGFRYEHGQFGAMQEGFTSVPPKNDLATIAIYKDGHLSMGKWGSDIIPNEDIVSFRQNGPPLVYHGQINELVNNLDVWGITITGITSTWRSGLAISQDGKTLYYLAGNFLTIDALAKSMTALHSDCGMQMDINNFWVHFGKFHLENNKFLSMPLFLTGMRGFRERYLFPFPRDFFYVTTTG